MGEAARRNERRPCDGPRVRAQPRPALRQERQRRPLEQCSVWEATRKVRTSVAKLGQTEADFLYVLPSQELQPAPRFNPQGLTRTPNVNACALQRPDHPARPATSAARRRHPPDWSHRPPRTSTDLRGTRAILRCAPLSTVLSPLVPRPAPSGPSGLRVTVLSRTIQGNATASPVILYLVLGCLQHVAELVSCVSLCPPPSPSRCSAEPRTVSSCPPSTAPGVQRAAGFAEGTD